jgi:hypothetical protein
MARTPTKQPGKTTTQTTRLNGAKVRLVTSAAADGRTVVTIKPAPIDEWELQAEAVRQLRTLPGYADSVDKLAPNGFTIAGDMNGDYRSKRAAMKAKATGIAAGDPDLRVYAASGRLLLIEYKGEEGVLTASQKIRHPLLRALGYTVLVIKAKTREECAAASVDAVNGWLALAEAA